MEKAIQKAIEGGYKRYEDHLQNSWGTDTYFPMICLDPLFWQALGKSMGWSKRSHYPMYKTVWRHHWHRFIDHLAEGKDITSFFDELLK